MSNYDASNRRHVTLAQKSAEREGRERGRVVASIMSTPAGRAWMLELLERCHVFATSFSGNALQSAFSEGERNVALRFLAEIEETCPDQYVTMMREKRVKEVTEDGRRNQSDRDASRIDLVGTDGRDLVDPTDG